MSSEAVDAGAVSANAVAAVAVLLLLLFVDVDVDIDVEEVKGSSPSVFKPFLGWLDVSASDVYAVTDGSIEVIVGGEEIESGVVDKVGIELDIDVEEEDPGVVEAITTVGGTVVTAIEVV